MNIIETNTKQTAELILRRRGRLIIKQNGKEAVVLGFGSSKATMLDDLNRSHTATTKKLNFEAA
jgi:hypothetical protein